MARDGWSVEYGIEKGRDPPDWWVDAPLVDDVDLWYLDAYYALSTCRPIGFGAFGPIPWDVIHTYALARGLDDENRLAFERVIREMDSAFLKWQAGEAEERRRDQVKPPPSPPRK